MLIVYYLLEKKCSNSNRLKNYGWEVEEKSELHEKQEAAVIVMNRLKIFHLSRVIKTNFFYRLQDIDYFSKQLNDVGL